MHVLAVEKGDVRQRGGYGGEAEAIGYGEEQAEVDLPLLGVGVHVDLEAVVDDGGDVVELPSAREEVGGEDGEGAGVVEVEPPVADGQYDVDEEHEADEDVDDGEEGRHERALQERGDHGPVQRERADADAVHAGADLVHGHRLWERPAHPRHRAYRREQVARDQVPREAADERDQEELATRHPPFLLLVQRPDDQLDPSIDRASVHCQ